MNFVSTSISPKLNLFGLEEQFGAKCEGNRNAPIISVHCSFYGNSLYNFPFPTSPCRNLKGVLVTQAEKRSMSTSEL